MELLATHTLRVNEERKYNLKVPLIIMTNGIKLITVSLHVSCHSLAP